MSLKDRIEADFVQAVRRKEAAKVSTLRLIKAALKNKEIENRGELSEVQIIQVLSTMAKQVKESIEQFEKGGRDDLVQKEKAELALLEGYLPRTLTDAELDALIQKAITELKAAGPRDLGRVMQAVMPQVQGRADGKTVQAKVKQALG